MSTLVYPWSQALPTTKEGIWEQGAQLSFLQLHFMSQELEPGYEAYPLSLPSPTISHPPKK